MPTVNELARAVKAALATYDNNQTWATGVLAVEYAEAGGYMGSDSAYKDIDPEEFAQRLYEALERQ